VRWDVTATAELEKPFSKGSLLSMLAGGSSVGLLEDKQQMYLYALPSDEHGKRSLLPPLPSIGTCLSELQT
jgi:hypothetical protein